LLALALVGISGALLALIFSSATERNAIGFSALVALVVQVVAFAIAWRMRRQNAVAGWGLGALLRFATLGAFGVILVKTHALPLEAAMISMAVFFFVPTVVEPLFLK
jgi:hypothetical protein